jgi:hypothetical protein
LNSEQRCHDLPLFAAVLVGRCGHAPWGAPADIVDEDDVIIDASAPNFTSMGLDAEGRRARDARRWRRLVARRLRFLNTPCRLAGSTCSHLEL